MALAAVVGLAGVLAVHHPMILSGFGRIQTDLRDTRLLNYFLEHGWLWVTQARHHERFWDSPFFHPVPNVTAYSDSMLSFGPIYWPFRATGLAPDVAFGAWMAATTSLNYAAGLLLFRGGLGFGWPAAAAAAGLIAFGSPRVNLLHHPQLLPCFYLLFALYALCRVARDHAAGAAERASWWTAFGLAVAAQFYGGYYLAWFFCVGLAVAAVAALLLDATRARVAALILRDWWAVALGAAVAAVALVPFLAHYLPVAREVGQGFSEMQRLTQPVSWCWWNVGEINWFWGWIDRGWPLGALYPEELRMGLGFATTAACWLGVYLSRRRPLGRLALVVAIFGVTAMTFRLDYIAAATACFALAVLFREPEWTRREVVPIALATAALLAAPAGDDVALSLSFAMMALCVHRLWRRRRTDGLAVPGAVLAALAWHSLPTDLAALMAVFFATAGALAAYLAPGRRIEAALGAVGLWLAATAWLSVERAHWIFHLAALGAAFGWSASGGRRPRPGPVAAGILLGASLLIVVFGDGADSPWLAASPFIPGSGAVRMPSRVILIFLVPAALGLAFLVERLHRAGRGAAAWGLALICLLEQTGTSLTYDRDEGRRRVAEIARRVDRDAGAFYYQRSPGDDYYSVHIDAMWASVGSGVPTINGISGCFPTDWWELSDAGAPGRRAIEEALGIWCDRHGLRRVDVQLIGSRANQAASTSDAPPDP